MAETRKSRRASRAAKETSLSEWRMRQDLELPPTAKQAKKQKKSKVAPNVDLPPSLLGIPIQGGSRKKR